MAYLERLTDEEFNQIFEIKNYAACIRPEFKQDIQWHSWNGGDPALAELYGRQDIVLANRFLCHMYPGDASNCLTNIKNLIAPGSYLFVLVIDLDVRQNVMNIPDFTPVRDRLLDIHNGDYTLHYWWPWQYYGLEPIPDNYKENLRRYAMAYQKTMDAGLIY